jgi:hypothetical protein
LNISPEVTERASLSDGSGIKDAAFLTYQKL